MKHSDSYTGGTMVAGLCLLFLLSACDDAPAKPVVSRDGVAGARAQNGGASSGGDKAGEDGNTDSARGGRAGQTNAADAGTGGGGNGQTLPDAGFPPLDPTIYEIPDGDCDPGCVKNLRDRCRTMDGEAQVCSMHAGEHLACLAGGMRIRSYEEQRPDGVVLGIRVKTLADGKTICLSQVQVNEDPLGVLIKDGKGNLVASFSYATWIFVCHNSGKQYRFDSNRPECAPVVPQACVQGECEWLGPK